MSNALNCVREEDTVYGFDARVMREEEQPLDDDDDTIILIILRSR